MDADGLMEGPGAVEQVGPRVELAGVLADRVVCRVPLEHGVAPVDALTAAGWSLVRPLAARHDGRVVEVRVAVSARRSRAHATAEGAAGRVGTVAAVVDASPPGVVGVPSARRVQRVAAYALVTGTVAGVGPALLATEYARTTRWGGLFGLPGGGLEPGEGPAEALVRECWEETGQRVEVGALLDVSSDHWVGRSPTGRLEDFHAVRFVYAARCAHPTAAVVHDRGGTTASAAWLSVDALESVAWSHAARRQLPLLDVRGPRGAPGGSTA